MFHSCEVTIPTRTRPSPTTVRIMSISQGRHLLAKRADAHLSTPVSVKAPNTETFLHAEMKELYPNSTVTVTRSGAFNILGYAGQSEDPIILRELEMESMKKLVYLPPASRRFGSGIVAESIDIGGWQVGWRDEELQVIVASVRISSISGPASELTIPNSGPRGSRGMSSTTLSPTRSRLPSTCSMRSLRTPPQ